MIIGKIYQDKYSKSLFKIISKEGDFGYKVYCVNGHWNAEYDDEMKMIFKIRDGSWNYLVELAYRVNLVDRFENIGYRNI